MAGPSDPSSIRLNIIEMCLVVASSIQFVQELLLGKMREVLLFFPSFFNYHAKSGQARKQ